MKFMRLLIEIYKTMKANFGSGCKFSFIDKFVYRWYKIYIEPKLK
jgi:hypothetical protein